MSYFFSYRRGEPGGGGENLQSLQLSFTNQLNLSGGNVGIGTTSPGAPLSFADTNALKIQLNAAAANYYGIEKQAAVSGGDGLFKFESGKTSAGEFAFSTGGTQRLLIASTGAATFSAGVAISGATAPASGIEFPATQVASASANNLDDYEEGTWTMGVSFGGASVGVTYGINTGNYVKIGKVRCGGLV